MKTRNELIHEKEELYQQFMDIGVHIERLSSSNLADDAFKAIYTKNVYGIIKYLKNFVPSHISDVHKADVALDMVRTAYYKEKAGFKNLINDSRRTEIIKEIWDKSNQEAIKKHKAEAEEEKTTVTNWGLKSHEDGYDLQAGNTDLSGEDSDVIDPNIS